jgi:Ni/Co efflux regulator RcnB
MRYLSMAALLVSGVSAAIPASAQVSSPGPVYYNTSPGTRGTPPAFHNQRQPMPNQQQFIPAPPAMVSPNPPSYTPPRYNQPNRPPRMTPSQPHNGPRNGGRWGQQVGGRWWGGSQAPGGWNSYRRPSRGHSLPNYWLSSNFMIPDYYSYGLRAPGQGYFWVRYYDDAVMVDGRGRVYDSVSGLGWDGVGAGAYDEDYSYGDGYASASSSAYASSSNGYGAGYQSPGPIPSVDPNVYYGGPGGYAPPAVGGPPAVQYSCPNGCQQGGGYYNGGTVYGGGGYNGGGYAGGGYYGGSTTTIIVPGPVITTTVTEEIVEETTTTTSYVARPRRKYRAPVRRKPRPVARQCGCSCACR